MCGINVVSFEDDYLLCCILCCVRNEKGIDTSQTVQHLSVTALNCNDFGSCLSTLVTLLKFDFLDFNDILLLLGLALSFRST